MLKEYPDVMTPEQVAAALCISRKSVYRHLHERTIGSKRVGAKYINPKMLCSGLPYFGPLHGKKR